MTCSTTPKISRMGSACHQHHPKDRWTCPLRDSVLGKHTEGLLPRVSAKALFWLAGAILHPHS